MFQSRVFIQSMLFLLLNHLRMVLLIFLLLLGLSSGGLRKKLVLMLKFQIKVIGFGRRGSLLDFSALLDRLYNKYPLKSLRRDLNPRPIACLFYFWSNFPKV